MSDFRILMNNTLDAETGNTVFGLHGNQFLIVERKNDILMISDTRKVDVHGEDTLENHQPNLTMYGRFLYNRGQSAVFLVSKEKPVEAPTVGTFFPVDGVVTIGRTLFWRNLLAEGQHESSLGGAWQFDAVDVRKSIFLDVVLRCFRPSIELVPFNKMV